MQAVALQSKEKGVFMGLFDKKQEQQLEVLKHEFTEDEIAFRYPKEDFYAGSLLYVQPGQEAVLIKDGDQDGPYTNGRYALNTRELPGLSKFVNKLYGGEGAFSCYLYFINKAKPVRVYWGTPHPLMVRDGETAREVRMMANGSMAFTISNSLQFIEKTNGQLHSFDAEDIGDFLFDKFIERITSMLAGSFDQLEQVGMPVKRIQSQTATISDAIKNRAIEENLFGAYGLTLAQFSISEITMNAEDEEALRSEQNELAHRKRDADMKYYETRSKGAAEADVLWVKGKAEADAMKEKGEYYAQQRMYDVLEKAASNESSVGGNSLIGAGVGLGVGLGVGGGFGSAIGGMMNNAFNRPQPTQSAQQNVQGAQQNVQSGAEKCPSCGADNPQGARFCSGCGASLAPKKIFCPSCGAENPQGARFCSGCGFSFVPQKIKCPSCGAELNANAKFCSVCGAKID